MPTQNRFPFLEILCKILAVLSFAFALSLLGDLTGWFKNGLLLFILETLSPEGHLKKTEPAHYQALFFSLWIFGYSLITLKLYLRAANPPAVRFGITSILALGICTSFFFVRPALQFINFKPLTQYSPIFYAEDGVFETLTAILLFFAAILFFRSAWMAGRKGQAIPIRLLLGSLGLFCLFFCMEEISWGQRILGWETPEWAKNINSQQETNLHNLVNKVGEEDFQLRYLQVIFDLTFSLMLLALAGLKHRIPYPQLRGLLHLEKFYFLAIFIAIGSLLPHELNEELLSLFFFIYSYDVLKHIRSLPDSETAAQLPDAEMAAAETAEDS